MEVSLLAWIVATTVIGILFAIDLGAALLRPHTVEFREAALVSLFYVGVAVLFGVAVGFFAGWEWGTEYFAGYILEKSLSVDNLFVFVVIMSVFAVPEAYRQRVLIIGIFLALLMRVVFILLGATLLEMFSFMFLLFGVLLLWTADARRSFSKRSDILTASSSEGHALLTRMWSSIETAYHLPPFDSFVLPMQNDAPLFPSSFIQKNSL